MPEGPEVEVSEDVREAIEKELEREGGWIVRATALTTALLAAIAAISALLAGSTVNEALVLKTEATRLQAEASDQWAYYQAKGIKAAVQESIAASWTASGKAVPPNVAAAHQKYLDDQKQIEAAAHAKEKERDAKSEEADHLLHRHHAYANAVALFQVAIALGAIAALTRKKPVWVLSVVLGVAGIAVFVSPMI